MKEKPVLINLSNHPSNNWSKKQIQTSLEYFSKIYDLEFPKVDPSGDENYIQDLVNKYFEKILELKNECQNIVVHIMGEMTFCFALITKLKNVNIKCISSTTTRNVIERENSKTSVFEFERFRYYN